MFEEIMQYYLGYFQAHGEAGIKTIANCQVPKRIVLEAYRRLPAIELLPDKEKAELKQYVIEAFPGKSVEELVECAKLVYTIGTLV